MTKKTGVSDRRLLITKNSILMLVMLVVIFLAIFAWYLSNQTVTAEGVTISAKSPDKVQIALPDANDSYPTAASAWEHENDELTFTDTTNFPDTMFNDVTSDGKTFIIPTFKSGSDSVKGREVEPEGEWSRALSSMNVLRDSTIENKKSYHYLSREFYVRSSTPNITVQEDSILKTKSEIDNYDLVSSTPQRYDMSYGSGSNHFSSDAIVGAMRVSLEGASVFDVNGTTNYRSVDGSSTLNNTVFDNASILRFVWLPRPDLKLVPAKNKADWRLLTNQSENVDTYRHSYYAPQNINKPKNVEKHTWYDSSLSEVTGMTTDATGSDYFHVSKFVSNEIPTLGTNVTIANDGNTPIAFTEGGNTVEYYVYKFRINVWIEGEDLEARRVMNKGIFSMKLLFGG